MCRKAKRLTLAPSSPSLPLTVRNRKPMRRPLPRQHLLQKKLLLKHPLLVHALVRRQLLQRGQIAPQAHSPAPHQKVERHARAKEVDRPRELERC